MEVQKRSPGGHGVDAPEDPLSALAPEQVRDAMLRALVEASPVAIVVIDSASAVQVWNPAAERLFGWAADAVLGQRMPNMPPDAWADVRQGLLDGDRIAAMEAVCLRQDRSPVAVSVSAASLDDQDGSETPRIVLMFEDLSDRKPADEARARLAAIVESSHDAIVGKTLDGIVTSWNHGAEQLFGYTAAEMIGQPIRRVIPPERAHEAVRILSAIARGERIEHHETERVRKDGRRITISLTVSPIRDRSGQVIGASKIARDISDRIEAERERRRLYELEQQGRAAAEEANRAKDHFLAMLGHELRNPLAAARNAIRAAYLDPGRRDRALEIARHATDQLARLVDDLLDVSRLTRGRIVLRREMVMLSDVIDRAVEGVRQLLEKRGVALTVALPPVDLQVDGDPARLEQVVSNLLSNAARYSEPGGRVTVVLEQDGGEAVLRVRDTGIGIPPDMLTRIFELFVQADQGLDRDRGGLGIGLTLVKDLVEMHGGRVEARSAGLGHGAELVVRLPAHARLRLLPAPTAEPADAAQGIARVLIVEDNVDAAESMMMLLELLGHRVRVAHDGAAALQLARANAPDVMLIDIGLPGMSGYDLAVALRADPSLRRITLIALTGYGREEDRQQALAAGFDYHLVKPVDIEAFQTLVAKVASPEASSVH